MQCLDDYPSPRAYRRWKACSEAARQVAVSERTKKAASRRTVQKDIVLRGMQQQQHPRSFWRGNLHCTLAEPLRKQQERHKNDGPCLRRAVPAKPGVTTLVMTENHIKTNSSGVQYQAECCYEQEDSSQT